VTPAVELRGISKAFGKVQALQSVDLEVEKGTIHAVVGENGAGKTTLMRVLYGAIQPDSGTIRTDGSERRFHNSAEAIRAGIGMVSQHYSIIPELTCLENLMLGAEPGYVIDKRSALARAQALAEKMGFSFDWICEAATLSPAAAQKLEILKLLWRESRIMILDEPTAMLSPADSDALFASLRQLTEEGATVLLVTHRLPEVMEHCKRVTVLRGGKKVSDHLVGETSAAELSELIVGHPLEGAARVAAPGSHAGQPLLMLAGVTVIGSRGEEALKDVSFHVREGEVLGIAGVDGNGQRELFHTLAGVLHPRSGKVLLGPDDITRAGPRRRAALGVRLIPEDRHEEGVVEDWSLAENAALGMQRLKPFAGGGWLREEPKRQLAAAMAERFKTKHGGLDMPMRSLSGGNQQRFVAARALSLNPKLILAFQPARGLDIDGTRQVYDAIREECARGACALVVSFDLDELLANCDRVVALNHGRIFEPPPGQEHDRMAIGRLMVGAG
jgi:general nucleoside transport system ATP-binding protein